MGKNVNVSVGSSALCISFHACVGEWTMSVDAWVANTQSSASKLLVLSGKEKVLLPAPSDFC